MINPLVTLRKEAGFSSPGKFAEYLGVSPSSIEQAEYATQTTIPTRFLSGLIQAYPNILTDTGYNNLQNLEYDYHKFQRLTRIANLGTLKLDIEWPENLATKSKYPKSEHPLIFWREQSNLTLHALSRAFCVHLGQLNKFEIAPWTFADIMPSLKEALEVSGYASTPYKLENIDHSILTEFSEQFIDYRAYLDYLMLERVGAKID